MLQENEKKQKLVDFVEYKTEKVLKLEINCFVASTRRAIKNRISIVHILQTQTYFYQWTN